MGELIDHIEHSILPSIVSAVRDKVVGPDVITALGPQSDARSVCQPEPTALGLFVRNLQPLTSPDPFDTFDVHHLAGVAQQRRDAAITVASVLDSERDNVGGQRRRIIRCL